MGRPRHGPKRGARVQPALGAWDEEDVGRVPRVAVTAGATSDPEEGAAISLTAKSLRRDGALEL